MSHLTPVSSSPQRPPVIQPPSIGPISGFNFTAFFERLDEPGTTVYEPKRRRLESSSEQGNEPTETRIYSIVTDVQAIQSSPDLSMLSNFPPLSPQAEVAIREEAGLENNATQETTASSSIEQGFGSTETISTTDYSISYEALLFEEDAEGVQLPPDLSMFLDFPSLVLQAGVEIQSELPVLETADQKIIKMVLAFLEEGKNLSEEKYCQILDIDRYYLARLSSKNILGITQDAEGNVIPQFGDKKHYSGLVIRGRLAKAIDINQKKSPKLWSAWTSYLSPNSKAYRKYKRTKNQEEEYPDKGGFENALNRFLLRQAGLILQNSEYTLRTKPNGFDELVNKMFDDSMIPGEATLFMSIVKQRFHDML